MRCSALLLVCLIQEPNEKLVSCYDQLVKEKEYNEKIHVLMDKERDDLQRRLERAEQRIKELEHEKKLAKVVRILKKIF